MHRQPRRHAQALCWSLPVEGAPGALPGPAQPDPALAASPDGRTCQTAGKTTGACKRASSRAPRVTRTHRPGHPGSVLPSIQPSGAAGRVREVPGEPQTRGCTVTHCQHHLWAAHPPFSTLFVLLFCDYSLQTITAAWSTSGRSCAWA